MKIIFPKGQKKKHSNDIYKNQKFYLKFYNYADCFKKYNITKNRFDFFISSIFLYNQEDIFAGYIRPFKSNDINLENFKNKDGIICYNNKIIYEYVLNKNSQSEFGYYKNNGILTDYILENNECNDIYFRKNELIDDPHPNNINIIHS